MKDTATEARLPGMPAPAPEIVQRREAAHNALRELRHALLPTLDTLRGLDCAQLNYRDTIAGDKVHITIRPGKETNRT